MAGKILVVDDEYSIRVLLKSFLEGNDFEVRLAADGDAAFRAFQEFQPRLIMTDIMMPKENGISLVVRIREHDPSVKVIYLSAWLDEPETERKLRQALATHPGDQLILKPFNLDQLLHTIREMMSPGEET